MRALDLKRGQPAHELAANLRRAFSGIVTGNVKEYGIQAIEAQGPYELAGDPAIMQPLDELLAAFVAQQRMRLPGSVYKPVYRLVGVELHNVLVRRTVCAVRPPDELRRARSAACL